MNGNEELKIIMVAPRGIGKTSILAAMHEEFHKTFERANLQTWVENGAVLAAIDECKNILRNIDPRVKKQVTPTQPKDNPWNDQGFTFEIGSSAKKFMKLRFTDPSGEYFSPTATSNQKEYIKQQLNDCDAILIPIDATALMQKKTGMVSYGEIGTWHEEKNNPQQITRLLKDAFSNVKSPRLIILAPVKCETYTQTSKDAENLLSHVKMGYSELLDFVKSDSLLNKVSIVVTPVQTIGNVVFAYHRTDNDGFTKFHYYKTPINAPYEPKDGDQPLRYIMLFLINVFLENKKRFLEQEQKNLINLETQLSVDNNKLNNAKRGYEEEKRILDKRNSMWWFFRTIANVFDDREAIYYQAKDNLDQNQNKVQKIQFNIKSTTENIQATQEQITAFNNALFRFTMGCKNNDGFAILQGHKWLEFPQSIF
ncbi:hypothetical protein FJR06_09815 [Dolichospermum sp. UHCC 0352]|uniref:TRAFAC clade GTPase domain-containing protein n=1 Tax=Dolichospermum sp. UHCC 0352 TaxID=2590011 RepID=UPI001444AFD3|nr:hypothetical protein [Dolichospermum sp. UHCC 0352]MTJ21595.1 hypothetical protein [Dolichospermum sp. UHCC 0352]